MKNKNSSKAGFTLLEILIAVLIIGVLTTIALPMYQGAVDKSKWARLLAPARAVSTAQEAAFMNYGGYTANMDDLDVSLPEGNDMTYTLYTTTNGDDANFIRITSTQLNDVRLAKYYKNNEGFEDQLYCEAKNGNDRANKLCGKLLKGQDLTNTDDGYTMYLIDDAITKPLCDRVSLWWSNNFTHCYKTEEDRCTANSMPYGGGLCGWTNTKNQTINEGGTCECMLSSGSCYVHSCNNSIVNKGGECVGGCLSSTINDGGVCRSSKYNGCSKSTINDGGLCVGTGTVSCEGVTVNAGGRCEGSGNWACTGEIYGTCVGNGNDTCGGTRVHSNFYDGSVCIANTKSSCGGWATFKSGSRCVANVAGSCAGTYEEGSCCEGGSNCPKKAPRC